LALLPKLPGESRNTGCPPVKKEDMKMLALATGARQVEM